MQKKDALITAVLWLENDATARKLPVGFPCEAGLDPGVVGLDCKSKITVKIDGKKVKAAQKKTGPEEKFWIWPMSFAASQKVKVEVTYKAPLHNDRYDTPVNGMGTLHCRLRTGATWAGPIKELEMRVDASDAIVSIHPPSSRGRRRRFLSLNDVGPPRVAPYPPMYLGAPGQGAGNGSSRDHRHLALRRLVPRRPLKKSLTRPTDLVRKTIASR